MDSSCVDPVTLFLSRVRLEGSVALFFPVCYIGPLGLKLYCQVGCGGCGAYFALFGIASWAAS